MHADETIHKRPAVFLDKDGTLIENHPVTPEAMTVRLLPGVVEGLQLLHGAGYLLIVVTNQGGVAQGLFPESRVKQMEGALRMLLSTAQIPLAGFYYCPHDHEGTVRPYAVHCLCRKPKPGLLLRAAADLDIDLARSWMIGDILHDVEAGRWAGCRTVLIDNGNETEWIMSETRWPDYLADTLWKGAQLIVKTPSSASSRLSASQGTEDE